MVQVVTGDSQEEVMIFRYKQTNRHFIIIYISSKSSSSEIANHLVFSEVGEELVHLIYTNPENKHQK